MAYREIAGTQGYALRWQFFSLFEEDLFFQKFISDMADTEKSESDDQSERKAEQADKMPWIVILEI